MKLSYVCMAAVAMGAIPAFADEPAPSYKLGVRVYGFNQSNSTYSMGVRFVAAPCTDVNYDITLTTDGVKDSGEAIEKLKPQIDKIADDMNKEREKRCK